MNNSNAKIMFKYILDLNPKFTNKENDFMKSVGLRLGNGLEISFKQYRWLEGIYTKYSGGGLYQRKQYIK